MRKVRQLCKKVVGTAPTEDGQKLTNFVLKLAIKYAILEAEAEGHKMAVKVEKQRRNRGKRLFKMDDINRKAQFFTPGRITTRRVEIKA
jgi:hypothetical protein